MDEKDQLVIDNMDKWADKLSAHLEKEVISIPKSVVALACIRLLGRTYKESDVLTENAVLRLVEKEIQEVDEHGIRTTSSAN